MAAQSGRTARPAAIVFGILLLATFGAFFLASVLKSQPGVLRNFQRMKFFSPNGDGNRDVQEIRFRIRVDDRIDVDVIDADGARVRRLQDDKRVRRGQVVRVRWNGRTDSGARAPDANYSLRVTLTREGRSVLAPRSFFLDTRPPQPAVTVDDSARVVAPGRPVSFSVSGTDSTPSFTVVRTDVSPPVTVRTIAGTAGQRSGVWDGKVSGGIAASPGTYVIRVRTQDTAGNVADVPALPLRRGEIRGRPGVSVRTVAVQPPAAPVGAGELAAFNVDARGLAYSWKLRRAGETKVLDRGQKAAGRATLLVRMPEDDSGLYVLEVDAGGGRTQVPVAMQGTESKRLLVVVPLLTWLGEDPLDADGDGLPDTLDNGGTVAYPRLYAYPSGLPTGIADSVGGLLAWMDAEKIRYDLTTDLAVAADLTDDRPGVLFAGSPRWIGPDTAARLRTYVRDGGRLGLFGPEALRRSVTVGPRTLTDPTPLSATDALGARIAPVRPAGVLSVQSENGDLGLFEGFAGQLRGLGAVEELLSPGAGQTVLQSVGAETTALRPALSAVRDGKGLIVRVGIPAWVARLRAGNGVVGQLTFNLVDVLRGTEPQVRSAN